MITNHYLYIEGDTWNWSDGVFSGIATRTREQVEDFCLSEADKMRHSDAGNYNRLSAEQREELAKRWEAAKDLPDGKYDFYFNLEDKVKVFKQSVKELAERLRIKYELKLKEACLQTKLE